MSQILLPWQQGSFKVKYKEMRRRRGRLLRARGKGRTNNDSRRQRCCLSCWCNVTAIMTSRRRRCIMNHHVHRSSCAQTHKNNYLISASVHYVHLDRDINY